MTEFSTNNDQRKPHFTASQQKPLQNSPIHQQQPFTKTNPHSPHPHLLQRLAQQQQQPNSNTAALGSSPHSPLSYRNPFNSPNNLPFSTGNTAQTTIGKRYQQQLTDRLLQQQHLQLCQQQQLQSLGSSPCDEENDVAATAEEISEESLKQNVAIVLSNLDRYNNALRSIILNEQVSGFTASPSGSSSLFLDDNDSKFPLDNNNFVWGNSAMAATPESDYNSNATTPGGPQQQPQQQQQHGWFLDYGYRDGCGGMQRSVLSSLSASYNAIGDLIYYEDLAKNLDANLAEVDMESFRAEDIHSLLSQLPSYCKSLGGANSRLQQSLLLQQQQLHHSNMLPMAHNMSQTSTTSTNELIDNSFCKSELLFSPVKESHISVDSLDMDAYPDDGDIVLTCNKDNYTIAFEGSVLYSDESFYEPNDMALRNNKQNCINLHSNLEDIVKRNKALEVSMSRSAQAFQPLCPKSPKAHNNAMAAAAQLQR